jgi:hypothetical protein
VLYAQDIDLRSATFEKAIEMANLHQRRAKMTILRYKMVELAYIFYGDQRSRSL